MDKKTLESKSISDLKVIASSLGLSNIESLKKAELISEILGDESEEKTSDLSSKSDESSKEKDSNNVQPRKRTRKRIMVESATEVESQTEKEKTEEKKGKNELPFDDHSKKMIKKIDQKIIIKTSKIIETNRRNPMTIMTLLELCLPRVF